MTPFEVAAIVLVSTLPPISKKNSQRGAFSQRSGAVKTPSTIFQVVIVGGSSHGIMLVLCCGRRGYAPRLTIGGDRDNAIAGLHTHVGNYSPCSRCPHSGYLINYFCFVLSTPIFLHHAAIGQMSHLGFLALQISLPRETKFTCNEKRSSAGILDWRRSISRGEQ